MSLLVADGRVARRHASITQCRRGSTIVEFALIAPVLLLVLLGMLDVGQNLYMISALQGVVQKAARDSTLENFSTAAGEATLDARVTQQVQLLVANANVTPTRRYYKTYAAAAARQAEAWTDTDHDGTCDNGETYTDANGNGVWDADGGNGGGSTPGGGAQDRTIYTVAVSYPRLFPMTRLIGLPPIVNLSATTVLANQPYTTQAIYTPTTGTCV